MVRFLHTADLHLDRAFEGLSFLPQDVQERLGQANQKLLEAIVTQALQQEVDFVLFAGDTFHQARATLKTQQLFSQQMQRLAAAKIPVYLIFGNHDYYRPGQYWFGFPDNVHLYTSQSVETVTFTTKNGETVALSGFSYLESHIAKDMVVEFPQRASVDWHIGLYHGGQGAYAPFSLSEFSQKGYDYWALGHIHVPQVLQDSPLAVYPGTPQGHTKKETEVAGVWLAEGKSGQLTLTALPVAAVSWENQRLDLTGIKDMQEVLPFLKTHLQRESATFRLIALELSVSGSLVSELDYQLASQELLQVLAADTSSNFFVWKITRCDTAEYDQIPLAAAKDYFDEILRIYSEKSIFQEELKELYQHPELHRLLTEEFQEEALTQASELIQKDFTFGGDAL